MIAPRYRAAIAISCLAIAIGMLCAAPAIAADTPGTGWQIVSHAEPTLVPGQSATIKLDPLNVGAHSSQGPVEVTDTLPTGVTATDAGEQRTHTQIGHELWDCAIAPGSQENSVVTCVNDEENMPSLTGGAGHWTSGILTPGPQAGLGIQPSIAILVQVAENAPEGIQPNSLTVSGGGGTAIAAVDPLQVTSATPDFGFARWGGWFSNADGSLDNQAGSVPYSASFSFDLARISSKGEVVAAPSLGGGEPRNISVNLPPGFIGNASALPQCTRRQLAAATFPSQCPPGSLVGLVQAETGTAGPTLTVFNMVPPKGQPAQFGFPFENINTFIDPVIRTAGD